MKTQATKFTSPRVSLDLQVTSSLRSNQRLINKISREIQRDLALELAKFLKQLPAFQSKLKQLQRIQVDLEICADTKMKRLNSLHRGKNKTTDVLSFPLYQNLRQSRQLDSSLFLPEVHLGDIVISLPVAKKQALERDHAIEEEIFQLFIHGFLHLCGYDHEISPKEAKIMFDLEEKIGEKIGKR